MNLSFVVRIFSSNSSRRLSEIPIGRSTSDPSMSSSIIVFNLGIEQSRRRGLSKVVDLTKSIQSNSPDTTRSFALYTVRVVDLNRDDRDTRTEDLFCSHLAFRDAMSRSSISSQRIGSDDAQS